MATNQYKLERLKRISQSSHRIELLMSNPLYELANVYDADGVWLGQFINEEVAKDWLHKHGKDSSKYEISSRRPERKER